MCIRSLFPNPNVNGVFVCNPFTREYINLLNPTTSSSSSREVVYGFGYHPCTNEHKVVSIHYKSWRSLDLDCRLEYILLKVVDGGNIGEIQHQLVWDRRPGLLANGALHWMKKDDKKIVSFDLADEEFRIVLSPPPPLSPNNVDELGVLEGCLCVYRCNKTRCESPKEIWVLLNQKSNVNMIINPEESWSWTKMEFSIPWKGITPEAEPHVVLKGGKVLLRDHNGLVSYDLKTKSFHKYELTVNSWKWFDIIPYTKSFVSLKALGE